MHEGQRQFRVIDYKSGSQSIQYDALYHGLHLQLPAYLAAFAHSHPDQTAVDACYFRFDQPILRQSPEEVLDPGAVIHELDKRFALQGLDLPLDQLDRLQLHVQEKIRILGLSDRQGSVCGQTEPAPQSRPALCVLCLPECLRV